MSTPKPPKEKVNSQTWFDVLQAARDLHNEGKIKWSARELAEAASLESTQVVTSIAGGKSIRTGATEQQHAAGWLSKFKKWGYVQVVEIRPTGGPVPANIYSLTEKGLAAEQTSSLKTQLTEEQSRLGLLAEALRLLVSSVGKPDQNKNWEALLKVLDEVDPEHATKKP